MPKKTSSVLQKVSSFVKLAKLRNPISFDEIFFKKKSGKFKFYRHYNYRFIQEYQFSPSNDTPLIFTNKKEYFSNVRRNKNGLQSMLFMCLCLGKFGVEERDEVYSSMEFLPPIEYGVTSSRSGEEEEEEMLEIGDGEYGLLSSVDERAEKFIEKFYAQMKMQGQESSNTVSLLLQ
ncbi:uncharacterized protein LOC110714935 [Chenopodium quinoa]|uniref:uncharacterized protein LOC110714935 n=1 Tax=Chenopodium quinoa TaxID=63459 RepID=UPI000B773842|nr:uncharacterized protein LOC110714935 [Chenopodium quinoa]